MDAIIGLIGSFAGGGIFGTILSLVGSFVKMRAEAAKQDREHKYRMEEWEKEKEMRKLEMEKGKAETENELSIARADASIRGMESSYRDQVAAGRGGDGFADMVRKLYRPILTTILVFCFVWVLADLLELLRGQEAALSAAFTPKDAGELVKYMIYTLAFSTSTAVLWWYGERAFLPKHLK